MRITKHGNMNDASLWTGAWRCYRCGCQFELDESDERPKVSGIIGLSGQFVVDCPECGGLCSRPLPEPLLGYPK